MRHEPLWIAGERVDTTARHVIASPFDGEVAGSVAVADATHMERAITVAFDHVGVARALPRHRRAAILNGAAQRIEARAEEIAQLITVESGKPIRFARVEVARAVLTFRFAAGECAQAIGEVLPADVEPRGEGRLLLHERVARGVVGAIAPFNFPLNLVVHKLAPAIAAGAPVVLKPPPQAPLTSFALASVLAGSGLPGWMLSVLHCEPGVAQRLAEDDRVAVLSFTGSAAVGWHLKQVAHRKQVILELGGNAPCIIDAGVDVAAIAPQVALSAFAQAGQVCIKAQRVLVDASLYDDFVTHFVAAARALKVGDPRDPDTIVGPLIEARHADRVIAWIDEAVARGARVLCGRARRDSLVTPTVLEDVAADARIACEEVFGPVAVLERCADFDDALRRANATRYGLQAGVFTPDIGRALRAFRELEYGGVIVNDTPTFRLDHTPYGGAKASGFGREGVRAAIAELTEPRVLILRG
jgi:acyl-CoA reductase-like NAD-dependent aldehyde dehydrogenase